mmetsp:Transcript_35192/g.78928  ORF Transcript_35192/g.78928 Transcript_35192/m.78928 type:complete len:491 (-) Transcript_35192:1241-2713(-)
MKKSMFTPRMDLSSAEPDQLAQLLVPPQLLRQPGVHLISRCPRRDEDAAPVHEPDAVVNERPPEEVRDARVRVGGQQDRRGRGGVPAARAGGADGHGGRPPPLDVVELVPAPSGHHVPHPRTRSAAVEAFPRQDPLFQVPQRDPEGRLLRVPGEDEQLVLAVVLSGGVGNIVARDGQRVDGVEHLRSREHRAARVPRVRHQSVEHLDLPLVHQHDAHRPAHREAVDRYPYEALHVVYATLDELSSSVHRVDEYDDLVVLGRDRPRDGAEDIPPYRLDVRPRTPVPLVVPRRPPLRRLPRVVRRPRVALLDVEVGRPLVVLLPDDAYQAGVDLGGPRDGEAVDDDALRGAVGLGQGRAGVAGDLVLDALAGGRAAAVVLERLVPDVPYDLAPPPAGVDARGQELREVDLLLAAFAHRDRGGGYGDGSVCRFVLPQLELWSTVDRVLLRPPNDLKVGVHLQTISTQSSISPPRLKRNYVDSHAPPNLRSRCH